MAEDLADAIVLAAKRMERNEPLYTIATMRQSTVGSKKFEIHGVTPGRTLAFLHYEDAYNFMAYNGFREVQGDEAEDIKTRILHDDKASRSKTCSSRFGRRAHREAKQQRRVLLVFRLPVDEAKSSSSSCGHTGSDDSIEMEA